MLKMELEVPGEWKWEAGQYAFLRFFSVRPLDNHPFTITEMPSFDGENTKMSFLVRPHKGITARIAALSESGKSVSAIVDGPYGTVIRPKVEKVYDHAILVAGGGGISGMLPWLQHLSSNIGKEGNTIKSVTLVWALKTEDCLSWVESELEKYTKAVPEGSINLSIWITSKITRLDGSEIESTELRNPEKADGKVKAISNTLSNLAHTEGRPNLLDEIPKLVTSGRTIVLGCGPEGMKSDLSNSVAKLQTRVLRGEAAEIRLHTETFGW